jgi:hypothetical protein
MKNEKKNKIEKNKKKIVNEVEHENEKKNEKEKNDFEKSGTPLSDIESVLHNYNLENK